MWSKFQFNIAHKYNCQYHIIVSLQHYPNNPTKVEPNKSIDQFMIGRSLLKVSSRLEKHRRLVWNYFGFVSNLSSLKRLTLELLVLRLLYRSTPNYTERAVVIISLHHNFSANI